MRIDLLVQAPNMASIPESACNDDASGSNRTGSGFAETIGTVPIA